MVNEGHPSFPLNESEESYIRYGSSPTQNEIVFNYSSGEEEGTQVIQSFIQALQNRHKKRTATGRSSSGSGVDGTRDRLLQLAQSSTMSNKDMSFSQILEDTETQVPFRSSPSPITNAETLDDSETQLALVPVTNTTMDTTTTEDSQTQVMILSPPPPTTDASLEPQLPLPQTPFTNNVAVLPDLWCECTGIYPPVHEIADALQDPGKTQKKLVKGSQQFVTSFPKIRKLCSKIYTQIQAIYNPSGLTKNVSRGKEALATLVLMHRKSQDVIQLDSFFHQFAKAGKVYLITNNPSHCGLDIPIKEFQSSIVAQVVKNRSVRTPNDGIRLALTLLDPKYRESVAILMTNRKDRAQTDINGDPTLHLFEQIFVESFDDPNYRPPQPDHSLFGDIDPNEYKQWDPNDPKLFEVTRDASWLLDTWRTYVKRKYKSALDRWNKNTGNGAGHAWSFVNYCEQDSRWLVMVFLQDIKANYLLASNAGGRMPTRLQIECGFASEEVSSLEAGATSSDTDAANKDSGKSTCKKRDLAEAEAQTKKLRTKMDKALDKMESCFDKISGMCSVGATSQAQTQNQGSCGRSRINVFEEIMAVNKALSDTDAVKSMSPRTKEIFLLSFETRRKNLLSELLELEKEQEHKAGTNT
jgi:hypothetical protein